MARTVLAVMLLTLTAAGCGVPAAGPERPTPDLASTVQAAVQATLRAQPLPTPAPPPTGAPTRPPAPGPTTTPAATPLALVVPAELTAGGWMITAFGPASPAGAFRPRRRLTLTFAPSGRVEATDPCGFTFAQVVADPQHPLTIAQASSSLATACRVGAADLTRQVAASLNRVARYRRDGQDLHLFDRSGGVVLVATPSAGDRPTPAAPLRSALADTRWRPTTDLAPIATLEFADRWIWIDACRGEAVRYRELADGGLEVDASVADLRARCPALTEAAPTLRETLVRIFGYEREGDRLALLGPVGERLLILEPLPPTRP